MTLTQTDIDWIVREVVRRLTQSGAGHPVAASDGVGKATASHPVGGPRPASQPARANCLELTERLITLDLLSDRLDGITSIVVPSKAVVTPAVRDELKKRKIELHRGTTTQERGRLAVLIDTGKGMDTAAAHDLASHWDRAGLVARKSSGALPRLMDELLPAARARRRTVLLTTQVAAAVCAANRRAGIRAIGATRAECQRAAEDIGANVVVMDAAAWDRTAAVAFVENLAASGWRECPAELRGVFEH